MPSPAGPAARFRRKPCRRGSSPPGWLLPSPCASAPRTPARACLPPRGTCVLFPRSRARGAPPPPWPCALPPRAQAAFPPPCAAPLFPRPALGLFARLALFLDLPEQRLGFAPRPLFGFLADALGFLARLALDLLAGLALFFEAPLRLLARLALGVELGLQLLRLGHGVRARLVRRLFTQVFLGLDAQLGFGLGAHLGLGFGALALALGLRLLLSVLARAVKRGLLLLRAALGCRLGSHVDRGRFRCRWRWRRSRRLRRGIGLLRRSERAEIQIDRRIELAGRLGACRGGTGRRTRRYLADESVLVELDDQPLELGVVLVAALLRDIGERRPAIDRREHHAVLALQKARLAGSFLDSLSGLRVDGVGAHSLRPIILGGRSVAVGGRSVAAASRRLDHENVARRHLGLGERSELVAPASGSDHIVAPRQAGLASRQAVRAHQATAREDRCSHRLEKPDAPHRAVAAAPASLSARCVADRKALEQHREAPLQYFGIGEARIGHVRLHDVGAVEARLGAGAAGERLVVLVALVA